MVKVKGGRFQPLPFDCCCKANMLHSSKTIIFFTVRNDQINITWIFRMKGHLNFMCVDKCSLNTGEVIKIGPIRKQEGEAKDERKQRGKCFSSGAFQVCEESFEAGYACTWRYRRRLFGITQTVVPACMCNRSQAYSSLLHCKHL